MAIVSNAISDLVKTFYSADPIAGQDAANEILTNWRANAIEALVPIETGLYEGSPQVELRLKHVAATLGEEIVPHLVRVIANGPWASKLTAAICFSGLKNSDETAGPLIQILKQVRNFDAERLAIEALGRLGASGWAYDLVRFAKRGSWPVDDDSNRVDEYAFEKLSYYALQALVRFIGKASDRYNADIWVRELITFIELSQTQSRTKSKDACEFVREIEHEFTELSVDPVMEHLGGSNNDALQRLCTDILGRLALIRSAKFLLNTAISDTKTDSVRRGAALALGEIRAPQAAQRLADVLKDPATDRSYLGWAFSRLYALPADWSGLSGYVDEVLSHEKHQPEELHYSLALKGDDRYLKDLIENLDDASPFTRWTSALALARLLGPKARPYLEHRAEDAADPMERCAMYAAMVRAGEPEKAAALHEALQEATYFPRLFSIWKLEILDAFRVAETFDQRAFLLWRDAARVGVRQLKYFDAMMASGIQSSPPAKTTSVSSAALTTAKPKPSPSRTKIFISYSHKDRRWLKRLQVHLKPLERSNEITRWDDTLIKPGEKWKEKIKQALLEAKVAVLLISADFLASDFIDTDELPPLLSAAESEGVVILPIVLSPCRFKETKSLSQFQSVNPASQPLNKMPKARQEEVFVRVTHIIEDAFRV